MVRQGNAAPWRPSCAARSRAADRVFCRQRSASATACGEVNVSSGSTKISVSQKACPSYPEPVSPFAGIARCSARAPAWRTWNRANRTACWISSSPSISTSERAQKSSRYARCSVTRPSQPPLFAAASAASTWSLTAGSERVLDQPYDTILSSRRVSPGASAEAMVSRATSARLSQLVVVGRGPVTTWSAAAATRSSLARVRCTSFSRLPDAKSSSASSGDSRATAVRGSPSAPGSCSLATSSDCTTIRTSESTGSTS